MKTAIGVMVAGLVLVGCGQSGDEPAGHPNVTMGRAEVTEALMMLSAAKAPVQQFYRMNDRWPSDSELAGMVPGVRSGQGTELRMDVSGRTAKGTLVLEYDPGTSRWRCYADGIENAMLPAECR